MRKDNSTLLNKLKQYSALVAPTLAMVTAASGQIVYTDVDPDFELFTEPGSPVKVDIDLDNDGVNDFALAVYSSTSAGGGSALNLAGAAPYSGNGNGVMGYTSGAFYYPSALEANAEIGEDENFWEYFGFYGTLVWYYLGGGGTFGQWFNVEDKYMGMRLVTTSGTTHYAWARMDVFANPVKIVLKDYALELTPDKQILAGSTTSVGIETTVDLGDRFSVFSYEKNIFVQAPNSLSGNMAVTITDMTGKLIFEQTYAESNVRISARDFAGGVYVVKAVKDGQEKVRKVSIQ